MLLKGREGGGSRTVLLNFAIPESRSLMGATADFGVVAPVRPEICSQNAFASRGENFTRLGDCTTGSRNEIGFPLAGNRRLGLWGGTIACRPRANVQLNFERDIKMDWKFSLLSDCGYQIVWAAGQYCRACRDGRDMILQWDGERWIAR